MRDGQLLEKQEIDKMYVSSIQFIILTVIAPQSSRSNHRRTRQI